MELLRSSHVGGGVVLHLAGNHCFHIKMGMGRVTNNYAELLVLKLLLLFSKEKKIYHIQNFGDSMNVINWERKHQIVTTFFLFLS